MSDKLITLITGANQGIGYYAAQKLAASGKYMVLVGSRNQEKGQKAVDDLVTDDKVKVNKANIEALQIDVDSDASIKTAVETLEKKYGRLDILVNNAGISGYGLEKDTTLRQRFQAVYNTNVFGAAVATDMLLPLLRKSTAEGGKRIVFTSSVVGSIAHAADPKLRNQGQDILVYCDSKSAENMVMAYYGATLGKEGFTVASICPGYCGTNLNNFQGIKHASDGATPIITAIESKHGDVHTQFIHHDGEKGAEGRYPF